jgi:hypothetical protein
MNTDKMYLEFLKHLYAVREWATKFEPHGNSSASSLWNRYCAEIGISSQTANRWLHTLTYMKKSADGQPNRREQLLFKGSIPAGFTAAVWWLNNRKKKPAAGKTKAAKRRKA